MESVAHNLAMIAYSFLVAHSLSLSSTPVMLDMLSPVGLTVIEHSAPRLIVAHLSIRTSYLLAGPFLL